MKAIILLGSRNPEGRTAGSAAALARGLQKKGWVTESHFLTEMQIERCRQCDEKGWGICRSEGRCVIEDDFNPLVAQIKAADAVVFASPVYFHDLSESLGTFLNRLARTCRTDAGTAGIKDKAAVGICMAGGSGNGTTSCCAALERILQTCGFDVVDMIPVRRQNLEAKLPILELTGKWLVTKPTSGPPFVPPEQQK